MRYDDHWRAQRFYRDPRHGKLMGVCAGLADYFGWNVTLVRGLAIVALIWFNVVTLAVYLVLGFLLPTKPDALYDWDDDEEYWRSVRRSAGDTFRDVRHRFRELDMKLQRMEGYVTSNRYDLDRQFRDLES
jgi:phage shock protein C